ncbi:MAG: hypothetical protein ACLQDY_19940 [Streptosporangiaceae bacterium]
MSGNRRIWQGAAPLSVLRKAALPLGLLAVVTAAVLLFLLRPGTGQLTEGPLGSRPENPSAVGAPARLDQPDTVGVDSMYNAGPDPAVLDRLVLVSPRHIKLTGAYITLGDGGAIIGTVATFPPSASNLRRYAPDVNWAGRHKPAGTIVAPHQWAAVALGLEPTAHIGRIASIDIYYHVGANRYEWLGHVAVVLTVVPKISG